MLEVSLDPVLAAEREHLGVAALCLAEIERCRPFFVGLLGERLGRPLERLAVPDAEPFDWLLRIKADGRSAEEAA